MSDETRVLVPKELKTLKADERGRVNLGSDYGGKTLRVAILEVEDGTE